MRMKSRRSSQSSTSGREGTPVRWDGYTSLTGRLCVCLCVCEREKEGEGERERERECYYLLMFFY